MSFSFDNNPYPSRKQVDRHIDPSGEYRPPEPLPEKWLFEDQIAHNVRGTYTLMIIFVLLLTGLVAATGIIYAPEYAIILALVAAVVTFFTTYYSYYHSDEIVLRMSRARPATRQEYPHLIYTLEGLSLAAGMGTVPKAYIIDDSAPNAFATGRDPEHSAIAVTTGLLDKLNRYEVEGVLAHEMSHVVNRDVLLSTVAAVLVGTIILLSDFVLRTMFYTGGGRRRSSRRDSGGGNPIILIIAFVAILLAPLIAQLMRLAVSRRREFLADSHAIKLTRYPDGLAGALQKIAGDHEPLEVANKATAHLYIANPLQEYKGLVNKLFSTHPPIEERIARLRAM